MALVRTLSLFVLTAPLSLKEAPSLIPMAEIPLFHKSPKGDVPAGKVNCILLFQICYDMDK